MIVSNITIMPSFITNDSKIPVPGALKRKIETFNLYKPSPFNYRFGKKIINNYTGKFEIPKFKLPLPGEGLPRILHYLADQGGCAFWRLIWPGDSLLLQNKAVVMSLYQMVQFPPFYNNLDAVVIQRQCTEHQLQFVKFLRSVSDEQKKNGQKGFKLIYCVDDLLGPLDILPKYNACREAFTDNRLMERVKEIVHLCDEMKVVGETMAEHYRKNLDYDRISVIPNYIPRSWADYGFDITYKMNQYKSTKKPRIVYAGSSTHFDILNKTGQKDDFDHVVDYIIKDITIDKKYQWVFLGGYPLKLKPYIDNKTVEYHAWGPLNEYPLKLKQLNGQVMIAPLADNIFNASKANIKLTEAAAAGMPCVAQNLPCYKDWKYSFNTGEEMMKTIKDVLSSPFKYKQALEYSREYLEKYWLDEHVDDHLLVYTTEYGSEERKKNATFVRNNPKQFANEKKFITGNFQELPKGSSRGRIY